MSWFVRSSSPDETFHSLILYLNGKSMKTLARSQPSYVKAEFGSSFSFLDEGNAKGEVEVKVTKGNGGSYVHLNFDFTKEYALGLMAAVLGTFSFYVMGFGLSLIVKLSSLNPIESWLIAFVLLIGLVLGAALFVIVMALEGFAVTRTKKRFLEEFNMFIELLSTR